MIMLDSTVIESVGYDINKQTMTVNFKSGSKYEYKDVLYRVYRELIDSSSSGAYFNREIKGKYDADRVV